MRNAETTLDIIRERGSKGSNLEDVYRRLYNPDLYLRAYGRIYRNAGALTQGTTTETADGMSRDKIDRMIDLIRHERYRWTPARRVLIPKKNGKTRPLGIPTWSDKLLQEVMRSILEAYYEPQMSERSHGFRPNRGVHTALRDIKRTWTGTKWFIEGDIKGCFDNIDHRILLSILREKIHDNRFLNLTANLLKAGYLEDWNYRPTLSGTPQGGIVSPILANIYLDRLDKFVENTLIPEFTKGKYKAKMPGYNKLGRLIAHLKKEGAPKEAIREAYKARRAKGSLIQDDPSHRRLRYIRYADDFLLGFDGPKVEAEQIKNQLAKFLREELKLELSPEKTLITHASTEKARFLGYDISVHQDATHAKRTQGSITLRMPPEVLRAKINLYRREKKAIHRPELLNDSDFDIVAKYGMEYRGFSQFYAHARNRWWIHRLGSIMELSLLKTLASKHKSTSRKMAERFKRKTINRNRVTKAIMVIIEREGKEPLVASFGGLCLTPEPFANIEDLSPNRNRIAYRSELIQRMTAEQCELCGASGDVQVHHIRKLDDLTQPGRPEKPEWIKIMAARKRKTLVVCKPCHDAIHSGNLSRRNHSQGH